ncbi:uracil-DNA glycosylase [soil metagenome]
MPSLNRSLDPTWLQMLEAEFNHPYFKQIEQFLSAEKASGQTVYPPETLIFNAFNLTPFEKVKVVILGQDPYHGPGQAHGLCFSVQQGVPAPPSLVNIYKELHGDLGLPLPSHGNLENWAKQGVLLLNAILTVRDGQPASHGKIGWGRFTDAVISTLSKNRKGLIFLLWGQFAINKSILIDQTKHTILTAPHPSPLSAHRGFLGSKHFSQTNEILIRQGLEPIDWRV